MAHIVSIALGGYKCLDRVEFNPIGQVNVLAGRNNVGKSAALQMLLALPTVDDVVGQFAVGYDRRHAAKLAMQGYRKGEVPWVDITTGLDAEEHVALVRELARLDPPGMPLPPAVDAKLGQVLESGLFRTLKWVWRANEGGYLLLSGITPQGPGADQFHIEVAAEGIAMTGTESISKFVDTETGEGFLPWLKDQHARVKRAVSAFDKVSHQGPQALRPHWKEVQSFLNRPRFFLRAQRRADAQAVGARTTRLDGDGANLVKRVETVRKDNLSAFYEIRGFVQALVPSIGDLAQPYVGKEGSMEFQMAWESPYGKIPLSESGTGIEQLLMLGTVLFAENKGSVIMLEEPENHLHPGAQERLLRILRDRLGDGCAFITTHSPVLVQPQKGTVVVSLRKSAGGLACGTSIEGSQAAEVLTELGVKASHFLLADVLVLVEGVTGAAVVDEWLKRWKPLTALRDEVRIVVHTFNAEEAGSEDFDVGDLYLLNRNLIFVADRDQDETSGIERPARVSLKEKCATHDPPIPCVILENARSLERLFPERAIREALPSEMVDGWVHDSAGGLSPFQSLHEHGAALRKGQGISERRLKRYNRAVAEKMTHEELEAIPDAARILQTITDRAKLVAQADGKAPA